MPKLKPYPAENRPTVSPQERKTFGFGFALVKEGRTFREQIWIVFVTPRNMCDENKCRPDVAIVSLRLNCFRDPRQFDRKNLTPEN